MTDDLHAVLIIATAAAGSAILWRYGKKSWNAKRIVFATALGLVAGFLATVAVVPHCPAPYPWVQIWLPIALGSIGVVGIAAPWRTVFFVAMVGIAVGLGLHLYSVAPIQTSASAEGIRFCQSSVPRAATWHSLFTGL